MGVQEVTCTMKTCDAGALLQKICAGLAARQLSSEIDMPLDRAIFVFPYAAHVTWTKKEFDRSLIRLVQHLNLQAATPPRRTSHSEALAEGYRMLAETYVSQGGRGYDAALVDVTEAGTDGFDIIVDCVVEAYRERQKKAAVDCVIHSAIAPLDWHQRCRMASALMEAGKDDLPKGVLDSQPARFADNLSDLIMAHLHAGGYVEQLRTKWEWDLHRCRYLPRGT